MNIRIIKTISIILLVSLILCFSYILIHINHHCTHDDNCPICSIVRNLTNDLDGLIPRIIEIIIVNSFFIITSSNIKKIYDNRSNTLVGLKVELNN